MASITSIGVGSGIDLEGLVSKIVEAERSPTASRLDIEETRVQANISAYGNLKSTLAAFQSALKNLQDASFFTRQSANSSDKTLFSASSDGTASAGNYKIEVFDKAQANKIATQGDFANPDATVGSGTLQIGFLDGNSFSITVAADDTLADIRDAINNASGNVGITASLITVDAGLGNGSTVTELVITSNTSGEGSQLHIEVTDDDGIHDDTSGLSRFHFDGSDPEGASNRMDQVDAAQNARIAVDGFTAYSDTNTFENVIDGISLTIYKDDGGEATPPSANLTVADDSSQTRTAVESLLGHYNELMTVFKALTSYNAETKQAGLLNGDSTVRNLESKIRQVFTSVMSENGNVNSMANLGVLTNSDGTITADNNKLSLAFSNNTQQDFADFFSGDNGIATRLDQLVSQYLGNTGILKTREDGFKNQLESINDRRDTLDLRIGVIESRLRAQFSALDKLVQQLNQTGNFLGQQLDAAAKIINYKN